MIRVLTARSMTATDIHHQIAEVYGAKVMNEGKVEKWVREFKGGRENIHDEECWSLASVITKDSVAVVEMKILVGRRFMINTLSMEFSQVSRSVLYKIVTDNW